MNVALAIRVGIGAAIGATAGYFLARAKLCAAGACRSRANFVFTVIAGAVLGAAFGWFFATR